MICNKCKSEWKTDQRISASLVSCPFCGESLAQADEVKPKTFDNTKDALIFIAQKHGNEVLLGKQLKAFFPDYAQVSMNIKKLVFSVYENGAASILQNHLNAKQADKEIAFKRAVSKLTEAFVEPGAAENIVREFAEALGWQLSAVGQTQQSTSLKPSHKSGTATGAAGEIIKGKRRNLKFGRYKWRVLDIQGDKALLLTENIIEKCPYNTDYMDVTWESCTLRKYLNGEFLSKFNSQEQEMILETTNTNLNNQWYGINGGKRTTDKAFLLSIDEVVKYFGDSGDLANHKGWYWRNNKFELKDGKGYYINDQYNNERMAKCGDEGAWWWLRSPGHNSGDAAHVFTDGELIMGGLSVDCGHVGVRPALWLNLKS